MRVTDSAGESHHSGPVNGALITTAQKIFFAHRMPTDNQAADD